MPIVIQGQDRHYASSAFFLQKKGENGGKELHCFRFLEEYLPSTKLWGQNIYEAEFISLYIFNWGSLQFNENVVECRWMKARKYMYLKFDSDLFQIISFKTIWKITGFIFGSSIQSNLGHFSTIQEKYVKFEKTVKKYSLSLFEAT